MSTKDDEFRGEANASKIDTGGEGSSEGMWDQALHQLDSTSEKMGLDPKKIAMVGDRIDWDMVPAKKLGMQTIYFESTGKEITPEITEGFADDCTDDCQIGLANNGVIDVIVRDFSELPFIIHTWNSRDSNAIKR